MVPKQPTEKPPKPYPSTGEQLKKCYVSTKSISHSFFIIVFTLFVLNQCETQDVTLKLSTYVVSYLKTFCSAIRNLPSMVLIRKGPCSFGNMAMHTLKISWRVVLNLWNKITHLMLQDKASTHRSIVKTMLSIMSAWK